MNVQVLDVLRYLAISYVCLRRLLAHHSTNNKERYTVVLYSPVKLMDNLYMFFSCDICVPKTMSFFCYIIEIT